MCWRSQWINAFVLLSLSRPVIAVSDVVRCQLEAAWGPWRCPGEEQRCTQKNATRYKCIGERCTVDDPCAKLPGFQESKPCRSALSQGQCVPWWASWSSWTQCTAMCGYMESTRFRPCIGAWSVRNAPKVVKDQLSESCAINTRAHEGVEARDCPIRRLCPNVNGGWGEWGSFTPCSVSCGSGFQYRMRLCNNPPPKGNGLYCQGIDTQSVPCDASVPCPRRGEWCAWSNTVTQCSHSCGPIGMGLRSRLCACPKPSHGGDSCHIPPEAESMANYEASKIDGVNSTKAPDSAIQAIRAGQGRWEPCNRHPCPYLKFLKEEEQELLIQDLLSQKAEDTWSWSSGEPAKSGEPIQLHCPETKSSRAEVFDRPARFPKARAYWTKTVPESANVASDMPGKELKGDREMLIEGDRLTIRRLNPSVTGVYRYGYEYEPDYYETVCFFIVYMKDSVWNIPHGTTFDLTCSSLGLWPVMRKPHMGTWAVYWSVDLDTQMKDTNYSKEWWHTELMKHVSDQELAALNQTANETARALLSGSGLTVWDTEYRRMYDASSVLNGRYSCVVVNKVNGSYTRKFITDSFLLRVSPPPTIAELVRVWCAENRWHLLTLAITGLVVSLVSALFLWRRSQNIARLEIQTRELTKTKKAMTLAELDVKIE